jgi:propionyl-CoA carboxylase alpha chain
MKNSPLFEKVLIANRGEIAVRIIKTLKKMGIKSVAVYSEADSNSIYVKLADEAYYIGSSPATESYLSINKLLDAISRSGAAAVHPGYGFLSENHNFASALKKEGVVLIGPSSQAIKKMGDKIEAKKIAIKAGINTVPGYIGTIDNVSQANEIAANLGFPVIVKAAAGGGGRGMRIVRNSLEMEAAYKSATLEALNSFDDSRLFIEKFIEKPRHIEIQVLADKYGNVVCLGERECSIQRHHQKIIEEAPSVFIDEEIRQKMFAQSVALSKEVGYYSAGTIEFIIDKNKEFYFLEMNTRLQVEHPVTELVTGIDIVEEMIKVAAGHKLAFKQEDVKIQGHAIECRIYAEDPRRGFLPSSGRITEYKEPTKSANLRVDTSVGPGCEVSMFYDPMIAKICTYDQDRDLAIQRMKMALSTFIIRGISHNISFLEAIINHPRFLTADISTNFIAEEYPDGFLGANITSEITQVFLSSAIFIFMSEQKRSANIHGQLTKQVNKIGTRWIVSIDNKLFPVIIKPVENGYKIRYDVDKIYIYSYWSIGNRLFKGTVNGTQVNVRIEHIRAGYLLTHCGVTVKVFIRSTRVAELESLLPAKQKSLFKKELVAPLTGNIISINVAEGDVISEGKELIVLTAMKMENVIIAEHTGKIAKVHVNAGENVSAGQVLITFNKPN